MLVFHFSDTFFSKGLTAKRRRAIEDKNARQIMRAMTHGARDGILRTEAPEEFRCGTWEWVD